MYCSSNNTVKISMTQTDTWIISSDLMSLGQNVPRTRRPKGQNVSRDKTSHTNHQVFKNTFCPLGRFVLGRFVLGRFVLGCFVFASQHLKTVCNSYTGTLSRMLHRSCSSRVRNDSMHLLVLLWRGLCRGTTERALVETIVHFIIWRTVRKYFTFL